MISFLFISSFRERFPMLTSLKNVYKIIAIDLRYNKTCVSGMESISDKILWEHLKVCLKFPLSLYSMLLTHNID